ncbi:MAG: hypothetical protein RL758_476 [Pseudomonadota bacterium]
MADYYFQLGLSLRRAGNHAGAQKAFAEVAKALPGHAVAQNEVGVQMMEMGFPSEAITCFEQAIHVDPMQALAMSNLGQVLGRMGRMDEALAWQQKACQLLPSHPGVLSNLSASLNAVNRYAEAEQTARSALQIGPALVNAHINLADALIGQGALAEAIGSLRHALALNPGNNDALTNLGNALESAGQYDEAESVYRSVSDDAGYALGKAMQCAAQVYRWERIEQDLQHLVQVMNSVRCSFPPFPALSLNLPDAPAAQRRLSEQYAVHHVLQGIRPMELSSGSLPGKSGQPLCIGYLSADIHDHATMHLLAGVLKNHDKSKFRIHIYSHGTNRDGLYRKLAEECADVFREISGAGDAEAAQVIADDGLHILVDLKGFTRQARLGITARRPAPLVVSWLGYPGTLGHPALADYIIADAVVLPVAHAGHYSEKIARMPHCYQPTDDQRAIGAKPTRESVGLPAEGVVFCSFNQAYKINPHTLDAWCQILQGVQGSVLWLLASGEAADDRLAHAVADRGIDKARIIFAPRMQPAEHLGRLQLADLALDTHPYGSHTTGTDALWAGVPLLARTGDTFASRVSTSLVHAVGLPDLAATDWPSYIQLAVDLALQPQRREKIRQHLREVRKTCPLFNTVGFTRDLEKLFMAIWENREMTKATTQ